MCTSASFFYGDSSAAWAPLWPPSPPSHPVTHPSSLSHLQLLWKARSPHRQTVALTHYTVKSSITRFLFCFSSTHLCVLNSIIINIVQNVTKKNVHLVFWVFLYTRQAEADYYVYRRLSPSSPRPPPHLPLHPQNPPPSSGSDSECFNMRPLRCRDKSDQLRLALK